MNVSNLQEDKHRLEAELLARGGASPRSRDCRDAGSRSRSPKHADGLDKANSNSESTQSLRTVPCKRTPSARALINALPAPDQKKRKPLKSSEFLQQRIGGVRKHATGAGRGMPAAKSPRARPVESRTFTMGEELPRAEVPRPLPKDPAEAGDTARGEQEVKEENRRAAVGAASIEELIRTFDPRAELNRLGLENHAREEKPEVGEDERELNANADEKSPPPSQPLEEEKKNADVKDDENMVAPQDTGEDEHSNASPVAAETPAPMAEPAAQENEKDELAAEPVPENPSPAISAAAEMKQEEEEKKESPANPGEEPAVSEMAARKDNTENATSPEVLSQNAPDSLSGSPPEPRTLPAENATPPVQQPQARPDVPDFIVDNKDKDGDKEDANNNKDKLIEDEKGENDEEDISPATAPPEAQPVDNDAGNREHDSGKQDVPCHDEATEPDHTMEAAAASNEVADTYSTPHFTHGPELVDAKVEPDKEAEKEKSEDPTHNAAAEEILLPTKTAAAEPVPEAMKKPSMSDSLAPIPEAEPSLTSSPPSTVPQPQPIPEEKKANVPEPIPPPAKKKRVCKSHTFEFDLDESPREAEEIAKSEPNSVMFDLAPDEPGPPPAVEEKKETVVMPVAADTIANNRAQEEPDTAIAKIIEAMGKEPDPKPTEEAKQDGSVTVSAIIHHEDSVVLVSKNESPPEEKPEPEPQQPKEQSDKKRRLSIKVESGESDMQVCGRPNAPMTEKCHKSKNSIDRLLAEEMIRQMLLECLSTRSKDEMQEMMQPLRAVSSPTRKGNEKKHVGAGKKGAKQGAEPSAEVIDTAIKLYLKDTMQGIREEPEPEAEKDSRIETPNFGSSLRKQNVFKF